MCNKKKSDICRNVLTAMVKMVTLLVKTVKTLNVWLVNMVQKHIPAGGNYSV